MIYQIFTVLDKAVGTFLPPFFARSKGEAVRSFTDAVNDAGHQFHKHCDDYTLYFLGEFDDSGARFSVIDGVRIITAVECLIDNPFTPDTKVSSDNGSGLRRIPS